MFYKDHDPPHFHAIYGDQMGLIEITSRKIEINLSSRTQKIVLEWLDINEKDILENWELAKQKKPLIKIKPLD